LTFQKDKTGAAQTAANAAATIVAAYSDNFKSFSEVVEAYNDLRAELFSDLAEVVDADNKMFRDNDSGGAAKSERKSSSSSSRAKKTSGGGRKGGSSSKVTLDDALDLVLNFGAFEGEKLGDILGYDAETCDEDYAYGDGERDGKDYISWLASDRNKNEYVQRRARLIADDEGIEYDD
jgi:hypothetical protein